MATTNHQGQASTRKTRRRHQKSRNGCFECKRRRVKCDEMEPSCTRCILTLDNCIYPSAPRPVKKNKRSRLYPPSPASNLLSPSPSASSYSERSTSFMPSWRSTPAFMEVNSCPNTTDAADAVKLSDTDLYHHYLQHTSRTLSHCEKDQKALQIYIPTLALRSKTVFHSLLAVSAACLGCEMISNEIPPDIGTINQVLMTGYQHYNSASERMREAMSSPDTLTSEPLLASALMLVPFATASQQINHWISSRIGMQDSHKLLSTTPRDVIIIMRGIRTMLLTLDSNSLDPSLKPLVETGFVTENSSTLLEANARPTLAPSRSHGMISVLTATIQGAFSKLQKRLESAFLYYNDGSVDSLRACKAAFETLNEIRSNAFSQSNSSSSSSPCCNDMTKESFEAEPVLLSQVTPWLQSFANTSKIPQPTEPLTRYFLSFLVQSPQAYLDLVLPLLDQRLENSIGAPSEGFLVELTIEQALALDIYAHWSVLMFLVEEESWWIGNLPVVTLAGMVNRYGDDFVTTLWPENVPEQDQWWPGSMLNILQEIKRYR